MAQATESAPRGTAADAVHKRARPAGAVALLGGAAVLIAFLWLNWLPQQNSSFADVRQRLRGYGPLATGMSEAYFTWLGWLLFGIVLATALAVSIPRRLPLVLRLVSLLAALAAIAFTFWALDLVTPNEPTYGDYLSNARGGFYLAVVGFLVMGATALAGARRRAEPSRV